MPTKFLITVPDLASLGSLMFTSTVNSWIQDRSDIFVAIDQRLDQYRIGDWGDLSAHDWQCNIDTIESDEPGGTLMGAYKLPDNRRLWIMTYGYGNQNLGPDYCYTTVLSPEDY